jgi:hypothetical protein
MTAAEAREQMLDWAEGRKSNWNVICDLTPVEQRAEAIARAAEADAAEVAKWGAVAASLAVSEAAAIVVSDVALAMDRIRP